MSFAEYLGVNVEFKIFNNISDILEAIEKGEGDIASGSLTKTEERIKKYIFGPSYNEVQQFVIYLRGNRRPKNVADLQNFNIEIVGNSSYNEQLELLKQNYPNLKWKSISEITTEQMIEKVWNQEIDCTIADKNMADINRRYYPGIRLAFPIDEKQPLAWIINRKIKNIYPIMERWFKEFKEKGNLEHLHEKYYSFVELYDFVDLRAFQRRINARLPDYINLFKEAGEKYQIPWTLLAAQAYQESHWNKYAKSPTGVRGIMMLTQNTAKSVGVKNRMNPKESIYGGAKYLSKLIKRVPDNIEERDKVNFALAGYNIGFSHIYDAISLAKQQGLNPNKWNSIKKTLPLLSQKKYYKTSKHGYCRGTEPVRYVDRIRNYHNILENNQLLVLY